MCCNNRGQTTRGMRIGDIEVNLKSSLSLESCKIFCCCSIYIIGFAVKQMLEKIAENLLDLRIAIDIAEVLAR